MVERAVAVRRAVRRIRRRYGLDVVEAPEWGAEGLLLSGPGVPPLVVRFHGPRFLVRELNGLKRTRSELIADLLEQLAVRLAKRTTSPSRSVSQLLARRYKRQDLLRHTTVIPNPVDTDLFQPGDRNAGPAVARAESILFVGRLERRKGPHILADALKQVLPACPGSRAVFVGADTESAPGGSSMTAYIRRMLGELAPRADFPGQVPREETRGFYRSATLAVVPSLQEPFGYTCAEALACGAAVVASNTGGLAEMITDGENGRLVPPDDAHALGHTLIELLREPAALAELRQNARRFAVERLDRATVARDTVELYEEVTSWAQVTGRT
jgi:glycosyltransferase involved in cell wall biosynthesis